MRTSFIVQPDVQVGGILAELLQSEPLPSKVVFVSAFANRHTLMRYRLAVARLTATGADVRIVLGVDMRGTSIEALQEVLAWPNVDALVLKNAIPGHTFHPKIYWVERESQVDLIVGSANATEGGFFNNYEVAAWSTYLLANDAEQALSAWASLQRFLDPGGLTCSALTPELITNLTQRGEIVSEVQQRRQRQQSLHGTNADTGLPQTPFGGEVIPASPPLPDELLGELVDVVRRERRRRKAEGNDARSDAYTIPQEAELSPLAFYMTLPKMRAEPGEKTIPGEARVPLEARDLAQAFWGWPDHYELSTGPRGGEGREYWNWKPKWKIGSVENPGQWHEDEVRMYMYVNSSDFRFYSRRLLNLGANEGDVVRIVRLEGEDVEFECVLAVAGTAEFEDWLVFCTQPVRNSSRKYGYA